MILVQLKTIFFLQKGVCSLQKMKQNGDLKVRNYELREAKMRTLFAWLKSGVIVLIWGN